jgi:hypothetical protein
MRISKYDDFSHLNVSTDLILESHQSPLFPPEKNSERGQFGQATQTLYHSSGITSSSLDRKYRCTGSKNRNFIINILLNLNGKDSTHAEAIIHRSNMASNSEPYFRATFSFQN